MVWITGASSGIGRALALELARNGYRVAASARRHDKLGQLVEEARAAEGSIRAFPLDVTDHGATVTAVRTIESGFGPIDIAVLAAGTHHPVAATRFRSAEMARLMVTNVLGVANCLEPLIETMTARRSGRIAIVSSLAGYRGLPSAAYDGATKAALINLAESLKFDLDPAGVKVQLIDPGFVETPLTDKNDFPMPFLMSAEDAAARIAKGLRRSSFEITFPKRFSYLLKIMRCLPYRLYFPLTSRFTRPEA